ncbi:hypothetical protein BCR39DRAFT_515103 [Naematelia encephala]|uniref:ubiquitinyl hydrolase 1 n=1 Tax=Naematelia encephala TaxID=71784 RepID=A0A1Y2BJ77_9TREE|nr:hypothetical protein BCR39DRAFT_515103 [Naematelia encephala]
MSRLRFPFRSQQSTTQINGVTPLSPREIANADYWRDQDALEWDKGKSKEIERLWGLENFGNTCYCNSVLQALYACQPFRQFVESYPDAPPPISPLGPAPGTANEPKTPGWSSRPSSPMATKSNPFDNPNLNTNMLQPTSPTPGDKKEKRSWTSLGRRPTSSGTAPPTLATIQQAQATPPQPTPTLNPTLDTPPIPSNPDQPPPTVFETIQTLFHHLSTSPPHQPLAPKKPANVSDNAQTASLLPASPPTNGNGPQPSLTTSSSPNQPQGPPLLASLPPPSAPRGGGPFQGGSLGRGVVRPEDLLKTVKKENEMFRGMSQQDAHEFLGWVLNKVAEDVEMVDRSLRSAGKEVTASTKNGKTFVQSLFEGTLTNETRCLSCESTSSRDELFLDLSIDIEQHTSVTACLRQFSASEMLCQKNKFYCDSCCGLQEAEKRMKIKRLPNVLALHLKRFKYQEHLGRYTKLFYRVPFPTQLRLPNTSDDTEDPDRLYELFACVIHIGNGPHHGHYVCLIRSAGRWVMCDDENIEPIDEDDIYRYFGDHPSGAGYVLFYQNVDLDLGGLGMKNPPPKPTKAEKTTPVTVTPPSQSLLDIADDTEPLRSPVLTAPIKVPLKIDPPSPNKIKATRLPSPVAATATLSMSTPIREPIAPQSAPSQSFPTNGHTSSANTTPASTASPSVGKDGKWYQRRKSEKDAKRVSAAPAPSLHRQGTSGTLNTLSSSATDSTTFAGLGVAVPSSMSGNDPESVSSSSPFTNSGTGTPYTPTPARSVPLAPPVEVSPTNMSSSVMSNYSSHTSGSATSVPQPPTGLGLGRQPSSTALGRKQSATGLGRKQSNNTNNNNNNNSNYSNTSYTARDRTVSTSSQSSTGGGGGGGGGLSRRLSGMGGKITRSSSGVFKLGLGKKDKDKNGTGMDKFEEERR